MRKKLLLFGAGKSATCLIDYLLETCYAQEWALTVVDVDFALARSKIAGHSYANAISINVESDTERMELVKTADIVLSLLPPGLHYLVALDCLEAGKNLLTASYLDHQLKALEPELKKKQLLFLCEMGLDPGIDHMSAMSIFENIRQRGGAIHSFRSHCGGLVAPESDDNPWHYKISWNPRNVVMAGKAGAVYRENGLVERMEYEKLFDPYRVVEVPDLGYLAWYPNRDSLGYQPLYGLEDTETFIRTTLRYPEFCFGWKHIIDLHLTDETPAYNTDGMSLKEFFRLHFEKHGFSEWLERQWVGKVQQTKELLEKLQALMDAEQNAAPETRKALQEFMMVDQGGNLEDINLNKIKNTAAATVAGSMHEANLAMKQLVFLGMDDDQTLINKGTCSAAEVLQFSLEKKLVLNPADRDMIVMLHEIEYSLGGKPFQLHSRLIVKGDNSLRTAMAKTVGLPMGIAAKMILTGQIRETGLHIPIIAGIYQPVLAELQSRGISFVETEYPVK